MKTDVCIITEGTYPYVQGGVSSWIHNLIKSLPELRFSVVNISPLGDTLRTPKYEIPDNILEYKEVFVHDLIETTRKTQGDQEQAWKILQDFYAGLERNNFTGFQDFYRLIINPQTRRISVRELLRSDRSWRLMVNYFNQTAGDKSFMDYYWAMRFIHAPILKMFDASIPDASIYHPVCTGYAGLLGVIAKFEKKAPLVLTEHGIYTHERKIEISRARWIYSPEEKVNRATASIGYLKDLWVKKFDRLSRLSYHFADRIVTLFEGNRRMQIEGGADPAKIEIIPNGIVPAEHPRPVPDGKSRPTVGFVGRIVPIKDVKTFIRAVRILSDEVRDLRVYVMGEGEEDQKYFAECKTLVQMLNLKDTILFTGDVKVNEYYPRMDVVVLTSISEAQPLSVLEAMGHGVPVVAPDVGACRELIYGNTDEDQKLGPAGKVTPVGNPHETAAAIKSILEDNKAWRAMSQAGWGRVQRYYVADRMTSGYRALYKSFLKAPQTADTRAALVRGA